MNPHGGAIAVGFVQLLASMLSGLLIDTVGRIPLLIVSSVFMSLALASFGSYVHYDENNVASGGNNDWIPLLCVLIFTIAFSLGELRKSMGEQYFIILFYRRNFTNFMAAYWRTFSARISRNWKLNRHLLFIFLCIFGGQNFR